MTLLRAGQDDDKLDGGGRGSAAGESGEAGVGGVGGDLQGARWLHRAGWRFQYSASDVCRRISARTGDLQVRNILARFATFRCPAVQEKIQNNFYTTKIFRY